MTLATKTIGQGQDIVLIHGWGADSRIWQMWAEQTFIGYRLTFIDLPGHGNSPELDVEDTILADAWQNALLAVMPESAIVVGWSLGGLLAQRIAIMQPQRVSALILIASSPCFVQQEDWLPALEKSLFARYLTEVVTQTLSLLKSFIALQTLGSPQPKQLLKQLLPLISDTLSTHRGSLKQGLQLLETLDLRADLIQLSMPTLWLLAEQDAIVPAALAQALAQLQPQAQIQTINPAGHLPFLSEPEKQQNRYKRFYKECRVIDRSAVRRHFSRASTSYDAAAILQKEVANRLAERLPLLKIKPRRIVDLGAGTGFLSQHIQEHYPQAQLLAVDLSEQMLRQYRHNQQANVAWWQKLNLFTSKADVHLVSADAYQLPFSDASVDMLVSSLMLQWCDDLPAVLAECRRVLKPSGVFFIASLGPDTLKEIRLAWQAVDGQAQQHLLNFADIHDLGDAVSRSGFADPVLDVERITLTYSTPRAALDDLKHIGATNANTGRGAGLMGKAKWATFLQAYQQQALADGRIPATFEVVYAHAFAGQLPQALSDGVVSVPISQIKRWLPVSQQSEFDMKIALT